jgi:hypothetical protein
MKFKYIILTRMTFVYLEYKMSMKVLYSVDTVLSGVQMWEDYHKHK